LFPLIRLFPTEPRLNILAARTWLLCLSALLLTGSLVAMGTLGLNFGVDFKGGTVVEIRTKGPANLEDLRSRLNGLGLGEITLQQFGSPTDVLINVPQQGADTDTDAQVAAIEKVKTELGDSVAEYRRTEYVGPRVGSELRQAGLLATVLAMLAIALYIWFRFEWQFAFAALLALVHDVVATVGFLSITQIQFDLATLAAVLTIAGYSINDTVVVFDRVRETMRKYKKGSVPGLLNAAVNSTLSRTTLTSLTTLIALIPLYLFGGEAINGFTAALIWGIVIGTYSTIGIAVPLIYYLGIRSDSVAVPSKQEAAKADAS